MRLYKFIEKEYLDSFFNTGSLRLGTIYDFKDLIQHGTSRGDTKEGSHIAVRDNKKTIELSEDKHEPIISDILNVTGKGCTLSGGNFHSIRTSPNGFIFCTSNQFSEKLFWKWNDTERLDSCYEIHDVKGFIEAINKVIKNSAYFCSNSNIEYIGETIDFSSEYPFKHPAFTKFKKDYSWQCENRMIWAPKGPYFTISPWIINVPEATKFCKPLAFITDGKINYRN